ncbi:MAG: hypothetical protein NWQ23_03975 [Yoonia sp.]|uniref:hypothetical protein n=1 Tax=Yoonia sp. TaxID=2212373 RepID=UPI00273F5990|nr:hypothetical protein [Yoonia sp.]MDP5084556.1 hypothetical protein [Yoonia sp.]MDP5360710.1 hypothetical protein [Paracoccaceae bacterium]
MKPDVRRLTSVNSLDAEEVQSNHILVIGDIDRWFAEGRLTAELDDYHFIDFDTLTEEALEGFAPDIILSPLLANGFDALDIAARLQGFGFKGRYRVVAAPVPNADVVLADIRTHAPDIDFDLLLVPPASSGD